MINRCELCGKKRKITPEDSHVTFQDTYLTKDNYYNPIEIEVCPCESCREKIFLKHVNEASKQKKILLNKMRKKYSIK